ncbi:MAG: phosphate ABC transporter substrate-binding/OmpA family protein [Planctomycetota bacterium]
MNDYGEAGKPKPLFYVVVALVVMALAGYAVFRTDLIFPKNKPNDTIGSKDATKNSDTKTTAVAAGGTEAADANDGLTAKKYEYVPEDKLPPVKGAASYAKMNDETVRFALNVWAGWAPIVFANEGFKPKKLWKSPDGKTFKVELVLIDDPVGMRDAFAAGSVHIGWGTVDMLPLLIDGLKKDSRTMPRVYQQIDWSNGGDGIVVRDTIKSISDLRGKTIVLAQNSPSQYFILNALINGGVQPSEVKFKYTSDAFEASKAFAVDKTVSACVSWAPDIYKLEKIKGNKMLVTTHDANHLIADVWFARADFAKDHPAIMEGLVRGIFDAVDALDAQDKQAEAAKWMADGFSIPPADALGMLGDAHWTNFAENQEFMLNSNSPTNFQRTWDNAYYLYKAVGKVGAKVDFDQVADFSIIQKLGKEEKYAASKNKYITTFVPKTVSSIKAESGEILTKTVVIRFFPNSSDLKKTVSRTGANGKPVDELYDPQVDFTIDEISKVSGQFGACRVVIEGHTDGSMQGKIPDSAVKELSQQRANAVRQTLLAKYPSIPPNQVSTIGMGWDRPADPTNPFDHAKNRRVEVKIYPLEQ